MVLDVTLSVFPFVWATLVKVKVSDESGSVSLSSITPLDADEMVVVASSLTLAVSSVAVGVSLTAVTFTVIVLGVELLASPSFTVKLKVV